MVAGEEELVPPAEPRDEFADVVVLHEGRAVDAHEAARVEMRSLLSWNLSCLYIKVLLLEHPGKES